MIRIHEFLDDYSFEGRNNVQVQRMVVNRLKNLIPSTVAAQKDRLHVVGFALLNLCAPNSLDDVDWPAVIRLAADICTLWQHNWLGN